MLWAHFLGNIHPRSAQYRRVREKQFPISSYQYQQLRRRLIHLR